MCLDKTRQYILTRLKRGNVINLSQANFYFEHISTCGRCPEAMWVVHIHVVMDFETFSNIKNPTYPDPTVILLVPDIIA